MAALPRAPTFAPISQRNSAPAVRAQNDVQRNLVLSAIAAGIYLPRSPTYAPIRQWNSAPAVSAQLSPNLLATNLLTPPIPRNFDYSAQPWNRLSAAAIKALADNYTNLIINTSPSPVVRGLDYSVQPWNGNISRAAVSSWADNYANRLPSGFLVNPSPPIPRNFEYSVQPKNKLSTAALGAWSDNYANRLVILPEPAPGPYLVRAPTYAPIRQWSSAEAVRAQNDVQRNLVLSGIVAAPGIYLARVPTYAPIRRWSSAEALRAQLYPNLLATNLLTLTIPRNFDYSVQPWNRLSASAIKALADNYANLVINTSPSPVVRGLDYSVQPWNGNVSRAAVSAWADNYANRLPSGFLVNPTAPIPRNFDYSAQPWNRLSASALGAWSDNYANRLVILPEPAPPPPRSFDWPVYPSATKVSSAAINAWADNYVNRLASQFLPFVFGPATPIARLPVPATPITVGSYGQPGLEMDRIWYRYFDSLSRRVTLLENKK